MEPHLYKGGIADDIVSLRHKLEQTTLLLEVLSSVNSFVVTSKSFEDFCVKVSNILFEKFRYKYIHIWIRDEKNPDSLLLVTPEKEGLLRTMSIHRGIVGKAIRESRTICIPDIAGDSDYINVHSDAVSELCIPILSEGEAIGAINIETDTQQNFENYLAIIELIAANLSHSLKIVLLYQNEENFHRLVENMSEGVWVVDSNSNTTYTNPALQNMIGYTNEELSGKFHYDFFDERSRKYITEKNRYCADGVCEHYNATINAKNGEKIPVILHAAPFDKNGTIITITDLREIRITEQKLSRTKGFLASITRYCAEAIVGINADDFSIQSWNVGAERMFGYKNEEAVGKPIFIIVPENRENDEETKKIINDAKTKGFIRNFETVRLHKNNKPISVSITCSVIKDDNNNMNGISLLYKDISAQKKWEQELQNRFEKMQDAYKEMGKQRRYLDYMIELVNMAASGTYNLKQISTFIVNAIIMISHVDAATLRLYDKHTDRLVLTAQSGLGEDWWSKKTVPYSGSIIEMALKNGYPLKILDIMSEPRYPSPGLARKNNLRSALIIPLEVKNEILGSLSLYLTQETNLSLLDDEFITIFAKQASIGLKLAGQG